MIVQRRHDDDDDYDCESLLMQQTQQLNRSQKSKLHLSWLPMNSARSMSKSLLIACWSCLSLTSSPLALSVALRLRFEPRLLWLWFRPCEIVHFLVVVVVAEATSPLFRSTTPLWLFFICSFSLKFTSFTLSEVSQFYQIKLFAIVSFLSSFTLHEFWPVIRWSRWPMKIPKIIQNAPNYSWELSEKFSHQIYSQQIYFFTLILSKKMDSRQQARLKMICTFEHN